MQTVISNSTAVFSSNNQWDIESRIIEEVMAGNIVSLVNGIEKSINEKFWGIVCGQFGEKFMQFQESISEGNNVKVMNVVIWDLKDCKKISNPVKSNIALSHFNKKVSGLSMLYKNEIFVLKKCLKFHEFVEEK